MENCEKPVQNEKKKRSRSDKVGRFKYNQQLLKKTQKDIEEIKLTQRTILSSLKDFFNFQQPMIEKIACVDEVDRKILQMLFEAGSPLESYRRTWLRNLHGLRLHATRSAEGF